MKYYLLIMYFFCFAQPVLYADHLQSARSFLIDPSYTSDSLTHDKQLKFNKLMSSITKNSINDRLEFFHIIKTVDLSKDSVILEDGSSWSIGWWYTGIIKKWKPGQRLKISYHHTNLLNIIKLQNVDEPSTAWGSIGDLPPVQTTDRIARIPHSPSDADAYRKIVLKSGWIFLATHQIEWKVHNEIFVFHSGEKEDRYDIWNLTKGSIMYNWTLVGNEKQKPTTTGILNIKNLLGLEKQLNRRVLSQPEASYAVTASLLNYATGLKDPKAPIGVFLFLGPTGVGKTELAKVLTDELYKTQERLIRLDMSHFSEPHSSARLLGSPVGYANHEEGGQLTNALKEKPQSVVLLDEIEKAHPQVRKVFLPVFDEGYINDNKNIRVECQDAIFIMTSNLCSMEIMQLFELGLDAEEILQKIEPILMEALSPELYNRVEPIVFRPLTQETMDQLVEVMLKDVVKRLKLSKDIDLTIDETAKDYLRVHGFQPLLGARPLKKLIQKKVAANISLAIIQEEIPNGAMMTLYYASADDSWHVLWIP